MYFKQKRLIYINDINLRDRSYENHLFYRQSGFISWYLGLLLSIPVLLYFGLSTQLILETRLQNKQICYIKSMNKNISALNRAPYLHWYPATEQWQCQQVEQRKVCLRQSSVDPTIVLLRISDVQNLLYDDVTLYRFVRQNLMDLASDKVFHPTKATLLWINGCWYDTCPEKNITLCQG